jgi:hypothetical protein
LYVVIKFQAVILKGLGGVEEIKEGKKAICYELLGL